jgi:hypothetical protein
MTGSIRLRRDVDNDRNVDDGFGNICGSTFFHDSSNKGTKKAEGSADRSDMPLENLLLALPAGESLVREFSSRLAESTRPFTRGT